jgi:hypothetical protein
MNRKLLVWAALVLVPTITVPATAQLIPAPASWYVYGETYYVGLRSRPHDALIFCHENWPNNLVPPLSNQIAQADFVDATDASVVGPWQGMNTCYARDLDYQWTQIQTRNGNFASGASGILAYGKIDPLLVGRLYFVGANTPGAAGIAETPAANYGSLSNPPMAPWLNNFWTILTQSGGTPGVQWPQAMDVATYFRVATNQVVSELIVAEVSPGQMFTYLQAYSLANAVAPPGPAAVSTSAPIPASITHLAVLNTDGPFVDIVLLDTTLFLWLIRYTPAAGTWALMATSNVVTLLPPGFTPGGVGGFWPIKNIVGGHDIGISIANGAQPGSPGCFVSYNILNGALQPGATVPNVGGSYLSGIPSIVSNQLFLATQEGWYIVTPYAGFFWITAMNNLGLFGIAPNTGLPWIWAYPQGRVPSGAPLAHKGQAIATQAGLTNALRASSVVLWVPYMDTVTGLYEIDLVAGYYSSGSLLPGGLIPRRLNGPGGGIIWPWTTTTAANPQAFPVALSYAGGVFPFPVNPQGFVNGYGNEKVANNLGIPGF